MTFQIQIYEGFGNREEVVTSTCRGFGAKLVISDWSPQKKIQRFFGSASYAYLCQPKPNTKIYLALKLIIINGPNLNLLGKREPEIYGSQTFEAFFETLVQKYPELELEYFQHNVEGEIVNKIHEVGFSYDGILLNAGAYTHTSVAISDAIAGVTTPVLEVHISNIYKREEFRHKSIISKECIGMIAGLGLDGYDLGIRYFLSKNK